MIVQKVVDNGHPDLLDLCAPGDLLAGGAVGDVEGVGGAAGGTVQLGAADVKAQVLQGRDLEAAGRRVVSVSPMNTCP